jgi:hypothetical protein
MEFEKIDKEALREWRGHEVTQAFVAALKRDRTTVAEDIVVTMSSGNIPTPSVGGFIKAIDSVIRTIERAGG